MAATLNINEKNGAGQTATQKTGAELRFKNADNASADSNNKMVVPTSGSDFSFDKWLRANVTGTFTSIENVRFYTDGSGFGTGVLLWAKTQASYSTPVEATANTGYNNAFSYNSGSSLLLGAGPFTTTGDIASYLVLMMEVQSTASQGSLTPEVLTISFDET